MAWSACKKGLFYVFFFKRWKKYTILVKFGCLNYGETGIKRRGLCGFVNIVPWFSYHFMPFSFVHRHHGTEDGIRTDPPKSQSLGGCGAAADHRLHISLHLKNCAWDKHHKNMPWNDRHQDCSTWDKNSWSWLGYFQSRRPNIYSRLGNSKKK